MKTKTIARGARLPILVFAIFQGVVAAGELPIPAPEAAPASGSDWCEWLQGKPGTLYKGDHALVQEFVVGGRFQWQAAYLWGEDNNGYDFSDGYTEFRRFRLGANMKFLRFFTAKADIDLVDDASNQILPWPGGQELGWGYEQFDIATLGFDAKKALGLDMVDALSVTYGRHKFEFSQEAHTSSKELLTVERSAISNKVYGSYRPTGVSLMAAKGPWEVTGALFSTDAGTPLGGNTDFLGNWDEGLAYYASATYQVNENLAIQGDYIFNDADVLAGEDSLWGYEWATSLSAIYERDQWGLIVNGIYGSNGDARVGTLVPSRQGDFWGLVVMPYYWVVDDKLQAVVRYQYGGADQDQGVRVNSRYTRADHGPVVNRAISGGRSNNHQMLYGGLNYYLCGHNLKLQAGLEYEWFNTPGAGTKGEVGMLTTWFGFRSFF